MPNSGSLQCRAQEIDLNIENDQEIDIIQVHETFPCVQNTAPKAIADMTLWNFTTNNMGLQSFRRTLFETLVPLIRFKDALTTRRVCKTWKDEIDHVKQIRFPAVYRMPVELIQQVLALTSPEGFNDARRTCRVWYSASLSVSVLRQHLGTMGYIKTDPLVKDSENPVYLARRIARECSLGADGSGNCAFRIVELLDLSEIAARASIHFTVSTCGSHAMLCEGCVVYIYRLQPSTGELLDFVTSIVCPKRVLAVSMDTSSRRYSIAILMVSFIPTPI